MGGENETRKLVTFEVASRSVGAPIEHVRETVDPRPITPLFGVPASVLGLISLRGEILAVLDVGLLLGIGPARRDASSRLVVLDVDGRHAALLVDRLGPLLTTERSGVRPPPDTLPAPEAALLLGVVSLPERPLAVLDPARVLDAPPLRPFLRRPEGAENRESR
ncbi:MAG: chemotaxis protein CheW [Myxococcales bacterium]|nr:chemotaxis protein CheW [Myxococcales bacterium]